MNAEQLEASFREQDKALNALEGVAAETARLLARETQARKSLEAIVLDLRARLLWYEAQVPAVAQARSQFLTQQKKARRRTALKDGILL